MADADLRDLERAALLGTDADAWPRLKRARERAGRCPDCGGTHAKPDTTSCRERGFLRLLREINSATSHHGLQRAMWEVEAAIEGPQPLVTPQQRGELMDAVDEADVWLRTAEVLPEHERRVLAVICARRNGKAEPMPEGPPLPATRHQKLEALAGQRWTRFADPHAKGTRARSCRACRAEILDAADEESAGARPDWRGQARAAIRFALEADPCPARAPATIAAARPWFTKAAGRYPDRCWQEERQKALVALQKPAPPPTRGDTNCDDARSSKSGPKMSEA